MCELFPISTCSRRWQRCCVRRVTGFRFRSRISIRIRPIGVSDNESHLGACHSRALRAYRVRGAGRVSNRNPPSRWLVPLAFARYARNHFWRLVLSTGSRAEKPARLVQLVGLESSCTWRATRWGG